MAAGATGGGGTGQLDLLLDLAAILCVATATTVVFKKLRQPTILGYLLAGLIIGPSPAHPDLRG